MSSGGAYDLNSTTGHICVDSACSGGNHFQGEVQIYTKDGQICIIAPAGYEVVGATCQDAGGRKDFVIQHSGGTNGAANGAAVVADEPAAVAEAVSGFLIGPGGGEFGCSNAIISVPQGVVLGDTFFLCDADEEATSGQSASATA